MNDRHDQDLQRAIDAAVLQALENREPAPLADDFAARVTAAARAEAGEGRRAGRTLLASRLALAAVALVLALAMPALAPAAVAVLTPLAQLLAPTLTEPVVLALLLAAPPVAWGVGYAAMADVM